MPEPVRRRRTAKQAEKWKKALERHREVQRQIESSAADILHSTNFRRTRQHLQHGDVTVNEHVMNVARFSVGISDRLHIPCHRRELIRGALLHDYFLYDWHEPHKINPLKLHGFFHPGIALRNALMEYELTEREKDIIRKHRWPLTGLPPMCREAWIVTAADKYCSLLETIHIHRGHGALQRHSENPDRRSKADI